MPKPKPQKKHTSGAKDELYIIKLRDREGEQGFIIKPRDDTDHFELSCIKIEKKPDQNNVFAIKLEKYQPKIIRK